jgi:thiamine-phosphate pyrophosphorylase
MKKAERLKLFDKVDIYPVTCEKLSCGRTDIDVLNGVIAGGAKIIQLREKELSKRELYGLSVKFREITRANNLLLIINDHVDIALACGADGVHLGQDDMPVRATRSIAPDIIIGVSTHSEAEALAAKEGGADYVNIGPIFPTKTKQRAGGFLGTDKIRTISKNLDLPFTVMGGINLENIDEVVRAGAKKAAVVSAITTAKDIAHATRTLAGKITV